MRRYLLMAAVVLLPLLSCAADYTLMPTDTLLDLRATVPNDSERKALYNELQNRVTEMSETQMQRYFDAPQQNGRYGNRGMGDGRIATH